MFQIGGGVAENYFPDAELGGLHLFKKLVIVSRDLSQSEKEITACKATQIHKMTTIFTQTDNLGPF